MAENERIGLHSLKPAPGSRKERKRVGRRNEYEVHPDVHLPHRTTRHQQLGALVDIIVATPRP